MSAIFKLSPGANTSGVTMMDEFEAVPALLVRTFGVPASGDGHKISGEFVFVDAAGDPFAVHDWKSTSLWEPGFPSPTEYWGSEEPQEFSISTRDLPVAEFVRWLFEQIERRV